MAWSYAYKNIRSTLTRATGQVYWPWPQSQASKKYTVANTLSIRDNLSELLRLFDKWNYGLICHFVRRDSQIIAKRMLYCKMQWSSLGLPYTIRSLLSEMTSKTFSSAKFLKLPHTVRISLSKWYGGHFPHAKFSSCAAGFKSTMQIRHS